MFLLDSHLIVFIVFFFRSLKLNRSVAKCSSRKVNQFIQLSWNISACIAIPLLRLAYPLRSKIRECITHTKGVYRAGLYLYVWGAEAVAAVAAAERRRKESNRESVPQSSSRRHTVRLVPSFHNTPIVLPSCTVRIGSKRKKK